MTYDFITIPMPRKTITKTKWEMQGGGVLLALTSKYESERVIIPDINDTDCDFVWVKTRVQFNGGSLHIGVFHFPPCTTNETYSRVCDLITEHLDSLQ